MADDIRNRVARAIAGSDGVDWDAASSIQREEYSDNADAALAEMGEPAPVSVREAARVLLGVKAGDKLDTIAGHALVKGNFWEGYRAVLRAIAEVKM